MNELHRLDRNRGLVRAKGRATITLAPTKDQIAVGPGYSLRKNYANRDLVDIADALTHVGRGLIQSGHDPYQQCMRVNLANEISSCFAAKLISSPDGRPCTQ